MPYGLLITRSFAIAWHHRYLWLLAFLGGEAVAGSAAGGQFSPGRRPSPRLAGALNHLVAPNLGTVVTVVLVLVALAVVLFLVSCAAAPALIRSSAELDAERPWSHRLAWRAGWERFGPILRLRLLMLLYLILAAALLGVLIGLAVAAFVSHQPGEGALVVVAIVLLVIALIPVSIVLEIGYLLGLRVVTLELTGAWAGFRRGLGLLRRAPGRVVLVWLLAIGLGLVVRTVVGMILLVLVGGPLSIAVAAIYDGDFRTGLLGFGAVALISLAVGGVAGGAGGAYLSSYWTLAYRRLEW